MQEDFGHFGGNPGIPEGNKRQKYGLNAHEQSCFKPRAATRTMPIMLELATL
jgi:hypothetical protein